MKKKEFIPFLSFLIIFLCIIYYNKKNTIIIKPKESITDIETQIVPSKIKTEHQILEADDTKIESIIVDKTDLKFTDWNIPLAGNITAEFSVLVSKDGDIQNVELTKSSGFYSIDKQLYNGILDLDISQTEYRTLLKIKYIISNE